MMMGVGQVQDLRYLILCHPVRIVLRIVFVLVALVWPHVI
jgi:hypothetical protein